MFYADGRSNKFNLGRHSLGTKDQRVALAALRELDLKLAVSHGLADPLLMSKRAVPMLSLEQGVELYIDYVRRPRVMRGPQQRRFSGTERSSTSSKSTQPSMASSTGKP